jgi:CO/xanthine dehydrogenase FAD-binding subunit
LRVPAAEAALAGNASIDDVVRCVRAGIAPIDDVRSTADYRARVAGNVVRSWLARG